MRHVCEELAPLGYSCAWAVLSSRGCTFRMTLAIFLDLDTSAFGGSGARDFFCCTAP